MAGPWDGSATMNPSPEGELRELLAARTAALVAGDVEALRAMLADDFVYTNASGVVFDKAAYLAFYMTSGEMRWQSQDLDDIRVRVYGSAAVVTCRIHDRASFRGTGFDARFRSTQVFVQQAGRWRYVAGQTTAMESAVAHASD
jgi:ketosteroid isomerase-like protein